MSRDHSTREEKNYNYESFLTFTLEMSREIFIANRTSTLIEDKKIVFTRNMLKIVRLNCGQ